MPYVPGGSEDIVINANAEPVVEAYAKANKAAEKFEQTVEGVAQTTETVMAETAQNVVTGVRDSVARAATLIAGVERKLRMARTQNDPLERISIDWETAARKMQGNEAGLAKINEQYSELINIKAREIEITKLEAAATKAAAEQKQRDAEALKAQEAAMQRYAAAVQKVVQIERAVEKQTLSAGAIRERRLKEMSAELKAQGMPALERREVMGRAWAAHREMALIEEKQITAELEKQNFARAKTTQNLVEQAQYRGADALGRLGLERSRMLGQIDPNDTAAMRAINTEFDKLVENHHKLAAQKAFDEQSARVQNFASKLESVGQRMTFMVTVPMIAAGKAILNVASDLERQEFSFAALLHSADGAKKTMAELMTLSGKSVYTFDQLANSAKKMLALGFKESELVRMTKVLSNAAAAMGGTPELLDRVTLALGQMRAKQRVSAEEMRQLSEAGIGAWEILAEKAGVTVPKAMELAEKKMFDANRAVAALTAGIEQHFAGVQEKLSTSVYGMQKQVENQFQLLVYQAKEVFLPTIKEVLEVLKDLLTATDKWLKAFAGAPQIVKDLTLAFGALVVAIGPLMWLASNVVQITLGVRALLGLNTAIAATATGGGLAAAATGFAILAGKILLVVGALIALNEARKKAKAWLDNEFQRVQDTHTIDTNPKALPSPFEPGPMSKIMAESIKRATGQGIDPNLVKKKEEDAEKAAKEYARKLERSMDILEQAAKKNLEGFAKIDAEYADRVRELGKAPAILANLQAARLLEMQAELKRQTEEFNKDSAERLKAARKSMEEFTNERARLEADQLKRRDAGVTLRATTLVKIYEDRAALDQSLAEKENARTRENALRTLEYVQGQTIQGKIEIEKQKIAIEEAYLRKSLELQLKKLDREYEIARERVRLAFLATPELGNVVLEQMERDHQAARVRIAEDTETAITDVRLKANANVNEILRQQNEKTYERIKDSVGELFDALVLRTKSWGEALKNALLLPVLSAIKEMVSGTIARELMKSMGTLQGGTGGGAGGLSKGSVWAQILGLGMPSTQGGGWNGYPGTPPFWGGGGGGGGWPAGTPPFIPLGSGGGYIPTGTPWPGASGPAGQGGVGGTLGNLGSLAAMPKAYWTAAKGMLTKLGNIGMKAGGAGKGVGGMAGGAMLVGGAALVADGLRRGGWIGFGETTAGGALIGAKFGGPVGAVIGAGIGAAVGALRMLKKPPEDRMIQKVQQLYRMTIDKTFARQLVDLAKKNYAGNYDIMLASAEARDMLQLYGAMRGAGGTFAATMTSANIVQAGGQLYQAPNSLYGQALPGLGGSIPQLTLPQNPTSTNIKLDGPATTSLMRGETVTVIQNNPNLVGNAVVDSTADSVARREYAATAVPGLVLR